ncbi:MAG: ATP-binding protein [Nanoarchaeota archaeon]|nr:ATP-binding protein [Nanoarchaeota archaeon]
MKNAIQKWNPWWENPANIGKLTGIAREALPILVRTMEARHIKDIIGVRRCGKTVLMYQAINSLLEKGAKAENILYLNFDDPALNSMEEAIKTALQLKPDIAYIFLDEIQNIKEWEKTARVYYDTNRFQQIFVSGSSASLISRDVGKTLTGRHITHVITPFSFREFLKYSNVEHPEHASERDRTLHFIELYLKNGGFPETLGKDDLIAKSILVDLYNDILARDIAARFNADLDIVKKIGFYLISNIGSPFSYNSIASALNIHYDTIKKYVPYFTEVFALFVVPYFSWKLKVQAKKDMKCYSIDTGIRNAVAFKFSDDWGKLAENAVLVELKRRGEDVYFWKNKKEVDFIVKAQDRLTAINVSYTDSVPKRETEALLEFSEMHGSAKLIVITKDTEKTDERGIIYVPLWKWLLGS